MKSFYVIDGHSQLYKAYFAIPSLTAPSGQPTNAILGFLKILFKLQRERTPDYIAVTFDAKGPTFRHNIAETYKANRPSMPDELSSQIPILFDVLAALKIPVFTRETYEADDILATIIDKVKSIPDMQVFLVTSDKDTWQLISDRVKIYEAKDDTVRGREWLKKEKHLQPEQVIDYLIMVGDSSDNIPGIAGIGPKTAVKLLAEHGSLENVFNNIDKFKGKLRQTLEQYRDSNELKKTYDLITLVNDVPIDFNLTQCEFTAPDSSKLIQMFHELGFRKLAQEIIPGRANNDTAGSATDQNPAATEAGEPLHEIAIETVSEDKKISALFDSLRQQPHFAISLKTSGTDPFYSDIEGVSFAWENSRAHYLPLDENTGKNTKSMLKSLLEDPSSKKWCFDVKFIIKMLKSIGINPCGVKFDIMLAAYLIDPSRKHDSLDSLIFEYLHGAPDAGTNPEETKIRESAVVYELAEILLPIIEKRDLLGLMETVEIPMAEALSEMELDGIKIDTAFFEAMSKELETLISLEEETIYEFAGEKFAINSPKQLSTILFEKLSLPPQRTTKTGFSTDEAVLTKLAMMHPLPNHILQYRNLAKLKSTYVDALPKKVNPQTGKVHTTFSQTGTETGRLSSSDPNLQNIPARTSMGRTIRAGFIPEKGHEFIAADYSQIELRMLAHFSHDPGLREAFSKDEDIHSLIAAMIAGVDIEDVSEEMRTRAKAVNFGIIYGLTPFGLSRDIGISVEEANAFINSYFLRYSKVRDFIDETVEKAQIQGYVTTILNRRRYIPQITSGKHVEQNYSKRIAVNTVIQGSAADLIKLAMINIREQLHKNKFKTRILLQIHDELLFESPESEISSAKNLIKTEMEKALVLEVPLKVSIGTGKNWLEVK